MSRTIRGAWLATAGAVVAAALAGWWTGVGCGGGGSSSEGCDPPCTMLEICVDGVCEPSDAGDALDAPPDDVPAEAEAEAEGADEAAGEEAGEEGGADEGRSEVDAAGSNVGAACTADTDCVGPGTATCLTTIVLPIVGGIDVPGGYCSSSCDGADPLSCGEGFWCVNLSILGWVSCFKGCTPGTPGECRETENYTCFDPSSIPTLGLPGPICIPQFF